MLTAGAAALAVVANGVNAAALVGGEAPRTRLGVSIGDDLGQRDQAAVRRKRALDLREQAARATEARLKANVEARQQVDAAAPAAAQAAAKEAEAGDQFEDLARIYQAMKPAKAAIVFEQLDMDVQMKVAQKMRERSTAMIMAAMTPRGAAALSMAMARRHALRAAAIGESNVIGAQRDRSITSHAVSRTVRAEPVEG